VNPSGTGFDPQVVAAFVNAFRKREQEIPEVML
jgi:HD-GYP domain-containing protein (c-di-GMP phosphodiesterase class II)